MPADCAIGAAASKSAEDNAARVVEACAPLDVVAKAARLCRGASVGASDDGNGLTRGPSNGGADGMAVEAPDGSGAPPASAARLAMAPCPAVRYGGICVPAIGR